ncbi:MAG: nucleotidyltransferase domain-containing protein [bacterium]
MAEKTVLNVVRFLGKCLEEKGLDISQIVVFGSQVKGPAREDSDIDIAIISEDFRGKNVLERVKMTGEPEVLTIKKFMVPLDIITMTPEDLESDTSLIADYVKLGKVVYPPARKLNAKRKTASG